MAELLAAALRRDPAQRPAAIQLRSRAAALDPPPCCPRGVRGWPAGDRGVRDGSRGRPAAAHGPGRVRRLRRAGRDHDLRPGPGMPTHPKPGTQPIVARPDRPARSTRARSRLTTRGHPAPRGLSARPAGGPPAGIPVRTTVPAAVLPRRRAGGNGKGRSRQERAPGADRHDAYRLNAARRQPILVLATLVIADSLAVILPVASTLIALTICWICSRPAIWPTGAGVHADQVHDRRRVPHLVLRSLISTAGHRAAGALVVAMAVAGLTFVGIQARPSLTAPILGQVAGGVLRLRSEIGQGPPPAQPGLRCGRAQPGQPPRPSRRCSGCAPSRSPRSGHAVAAAAAFWPLGTPTGTLVHLPAFPGLFGHLRPRRLPFWF